MAAVGIVLCVGLLSVSSSDTVSSEFVAQNAVEDCVWPTSIMHGFVQVFSPDDDAAVTSNSTKSGSRAIYDCSTGFHISNGSVVITCVDGIWQGDLPICSPKPLTNSCPQPPTVKDGQPYLDDGSMLNDKKMGFADDTKIIYICDYGYFLQGSSVVICKMGEWIGQVPKCLPEEKYCNSSPPELAHGDYSMHGKDMFTSKKFPPGLRAFYYCNNGYRFKDADISILTCMDGIWKGNITSCIPRTSCDPPMDIENGNWIIKSLYPDYRIGVTVLYECDEGFKAVGANEIVCQAPGYWSDYGPRCIPLDLYCAEPEAAINGFFICKPRHCNFFQVGTEIHHICNKNFEPFPPTRLVQTCMPGGLWSGEKPLCVHVNYATTFVYSLNDNSIESVTVVVSTACGVLGLMISIITVVVLKHRRKQRHHLYPTSPGPPSPLDYSGHHQTDNHDHEALIPYIEFACPVAPTLPTYEETLVDSPSTVSLASSTRPVYHKFCTPPGSQSLSSGIPFQQGTALLESGPHRNLNAAVSSGTVHIDNLPHTFESIGASSDSDVTSTSVMVVNCNSLASNPSLSTSHDVTAVSTDFASTNELLSFDGARDNWTSF